MTLNFASALCDLEELGIGGGEEEEEEEGMAKARRDEARQVLLTDFCRLIPPDPPYGSIFGIPSFRFIINFFLSSLDPTQPGPLSYTVRGRPLSPYSPCAPQTPTPPALHSPGTPFPLLEPCSRNES